MKTSRIRSGIAGLSLFAAVLTALVFGLAHNPSDVVAVPQGAREALLRPVSAQEVDASRLLSNDREAVLGPASVVGPEVAADTHSILVKFAPETSSEARDTRLKEAGLVPVRTIAQLGISVAEAGGTASQAFYEQALDRLRTMPEVLWAEPSHQLERQLEPNDPVYPYQWGPGAVGLDSAWDVTTGSGSVTIAVIDTGLGYVDDFEGRVVDPYSIPFGTSAQWAWTDIEGHGTGCAGIAAAMGNDGQGMAGAAWNVQLMPIHVSDYESPSTDEVAEAFAYATDHGADIISISMGSYAISQTLASAVNYAVSRGVLVVASTGNNGSGSGVTYPAAYPGVIAVGATDPANARSSFSSTGDELDLMAPGESIMTYVYAGDGYWSFDSLDGTSFATPLVAGVASLMLSRNAGLSPQRASDILAATADDLGSPGWDSYNGDGLLDADEAVASAGDRTAPNASFTKPPAGSVVSGQAEFHLTVSDNVGVYKVEQFLDGEIQFTTMARIPHYYDEALGGALYTQDLHQPIVSVLDSPQFPDGSSHTLTARAYDAAGNVKEVSLPFVVDNHSSTTTTQPSTTTTTTLPPGGGFSDVPASHPYALQIGDLAARGIVTGFTDGTFRPDSWVIRQQFGKMIVKTMGYPVSEADISPFIDVQGDAGSTDPLYPDHYVAVCAAHGITLGKTATVFAPFDQITRAQLITMVMRAANLPDPPAGYTPPFAVFDDKHYPFARRAAYAGLLDGLQGVGPEYKFFNPATRGEISVLLYNLLHR